jgi:Ca2+/H+ antiporter, TMEM165/GDT1 family
MKAKWIFRGLKIAVLVTLGLAAFGFVAMHLWNFLMPAIFGLRIITFWQAVGLMVLGRLLFGGFRPRPGGMPWRRKMMERWEQMTPEQREKFREGMRHRCGQPSTPAAQPNA